MVRTRAGFAVCSYGVGPCIPVRSSSRAGLLAGSERLDIRGLPHVAGVRRENVGYRVYTAQGNLEHITAPQVTYRLEQVQEVRDSARLAMRKAQLGWIRDKEKKHHAYQVGDQVWLDGRNIKTYHPTAKLAPKRHGPFPIKRVLSTITYQLTLPEQWKIHDVFHVDLLTPYRETGFHVPITPNRHLTLSEKKNNTKWSKCWMSATMGAGRRSNTW